MTPTSRATILAALAEELKQSSKPVQFQVAERVRDGSIWSITVSLGDFGGGGLDETLEGSTAWWPGPPKGAADVLCVVPEDLKIHLRFATGDPPPPGEKLLVYPPRYLEALARCWADEAWSVTCLKWLDRLLSHNTCDLTRAPARGDTGTALRPQQLKALGLLGWNVGFLWGPPGTGKTYTLGAMIAQHLVSFPEKRVL